MARKSNNTKIFAALAFFFAVFGGFGIAGHLTSVMALGFEIRPSFPALVQAHGHLQLLGWVGLLIMGVSLDMFPRLLSRPLSFDPKIIAIMGASGIFFRSISQIFLPYFPLRLLNLTFFLGAIFECLAILLYLYLLFNCFTAGKLRSRQEVSRLIPYVLASVIGWIFFLGGNFYSAFQSYRASSYLINPGLKLFQTDLFLYLTLIPLSLVFSVKLLPLFLGLREPRWPVARAGILILSAATLRSFALVNKSQQIEITAAMVLFLSICYFIWQIDFLRTVKPERLETQITEASLRGRGFLPDKGEYGRFELHIYAAYVWLLIASFMDLLKSSGVLLSPDAVRHAYLLGFIANLIFGVGHRLLPGMIDTKIRAPSLVLAGFLMLNAAAAGRILPLIADIKSVAFVSKWAFALSGSLGLLAVSLMTFNIFKKDQR